MIGDLYKINLTNLMLNPIEEYMLELIQEDQFIWRLLIEAMIFVLILMIVVVIIKVILLFIQLVLWIHCYLSAHQQDYQARDYLPSICTLRIAIYPILCVWYSSIFWYPSLYHP